MIAQSTQLNFSVDATFIYCTAILYIHILTASDYLCYFDRPLIVALIE